MYNFKSHLGGLGKHKDGIQAITKESNCSTNARNSITEKGWKEKVLTQVTLAMSEVLKTKGKEELYINTVLNFIMLCPTGIQVNNSDTIIHVY